MLRQDEEFEDWPEQGPRTFWWETGYWLVVGWALAVILGYLVAFGAP